MVICWLKSLKFVLVEQEGTFFVQLNNRVN